ncbi:peptide/nickel transport system permease protein [Neorhizobium galegae]|uniref:ABC transporter permease n=1 Tax=Neorhizobium galegae TaxID=399 RepID=UPI001AE1A3F3|nr:ABC transporter permease [Neorhizobium galegae]MBP2551387.1 peptide/nickel transport system permease protein [Neorhizobium galegae]
MLHYVLSRLLRAAVSIVMVVTFVFVVLRMSGDPATVIMGADAPPEAIDAFRKAWGLDQPVWIQYFAFFEAVFSGELGRSMRDGRDVVAVVLERVPSTLSLTVPAFLINIAVGIPAGVHAALHRNSLIDRCVMVMAVTGFAVPSFILAMLLVLIFSVNLGWLPSAGQDSWLNAILPIATMGFGGAALLARFTRSAMLEVLGQSYIRTASAKGLPWPAVVWRHALQNAAIPTITIIGFMLGGLVAGAVVVESVFSWPGVGRLLVVSVANRDLAVVQAIVLMIAMTMVAANMVVDVLYGLVDPRMQGQARGARR